MPCSIFDTVHPAFTNWVGNISFLVLYGMVYIIICMNTNTGRQTPFKSRRIRNNKFNRIKSNHRRDWFRDRMDRKRRLGKKKRKPKPLYHLTIIGQLHLLLAIICIGIESLLKQTKHWLLRVFQSVVCNDSVKHDVISYITLFRVTIYWLFSETIVSQTLAGSIGSKATKGLTSFVIFGLIYFIMEASLTDAVLSKEEKARRKNAQRRMKRARESETEKTRRKAQQRERAEENRERNNAKRRRKNKGTRSSSANAAHRSSERVRLQQYREECRRKKNINRRNKSLMMDAASALQVTNLNRNNTDDRIHKSHVCL
eukprot:scaffold14438_cov86-Cyclotella_meneghiniana.AAC.1